MILIVFNNNTSPKLVLGEVKIFYSMKKFLVLTLFLSCFSASLNICYSQGETANWLWCESALKFENDTVIPIYASYDQLSGASAGPACISNKEGKLLIFTTGEEIYYPLYNGQYYPCYNNLNCYGLDTMQNGDNMYGDRSATQQIIIPRPGYQNRFYVINIPLVQGNYSALRYSEVDISLNNGNGAVLNPKNNTLFGAQNITARVTAVSHANGKDIWVMVHNRWDNLFLAYLVSENGFSQFPVGSYVGENHNGNGNMSLIGEMKFSPDAKRLAVAIEGNNIVQLFDFDNSTGMVSNPVSFTNVFQPTSVEFSPDGTVFYYGSTRKPLFSYGLFLDTCYIYQADLISMDSSTIVNSTFQIFESNYPYYHFCCMQLAYNGKIYVDLSSDLLIPSISIDTIRIINFPNKPGVSCNFNSNGPVFTQVQSEHWHLPNFYRTYLDRNILFENLCYGDTTLICTQTNTNFDSIRWEFEDAQVGLSFSIPNQDTVYHTFSEPGSYEFTLKRYRDGYLDEVKKMLYILPVVNTNLGPDTLLCEGQTLEIELNYPYCDFEWQNDSAFGFMYGDTVALSQPANWWPILTNFDEYCGLLDTVEISVHPDSLDLGNDTSGICISNPLQLDATLGGNTSYQWSTGDTTASLLAVDNGYYMVTVHQGFCTFYDTILIAYDEILPVDLPDTIYLCDSLPQMLSAGDFPANFIWSPTEDTIADIIIETSGIYSVTASNACGNFVDSAQAVYMQQPVANLGNDTIICFGNYLHLAVQAFPHTTYFWSSGATDTSIMVFDQGYYSLSVSNACGDTIDSLFVEVHENLFAFQFDTLFLPENQTAILDAGQGFIAYIWSTGNTTQSITVGSQATYWVSVTDSLGCLASDSIEVVIIYSISEKNRFSKVKIYPNPVTEELIIEGLEGDEKIRVADMLGREVKSIDPTHPMTLSHRMSFRFSQQPNGIYFLTIEKNKGAMKVYKIIKQQL